MEKIQITKDMLPEFKVFLAQPGLKCEIIGNFDGSECDIICTETEQVFHLDEEATKQLNTKYDPIIFGKDDTENIISIEVSDTDVTLFKEIDGVISTEMRPYSPWLLTTRSLGPTSKMLSGKQPYKFLTEFPSIQDWQKAKQYLRKKQTDHYVLNDLKEQYMIRNGLTYFKGMQPKDVSILSFDIETTGLVFDDTSEVLLITNTYRKGNYRYKKTFDIFDYNCQQQDMIQDWCEWVRGIDPSVMVGHNIYSYDLKYMNHVATNLNLGRDNSNIHFNTYTSQFRKDGSQTYDYNKCRIYGREMVDTFFLAIKYDIFRKYVSYGLKQIIKQEGLEKIGRTFIDASKIKDVYYTLKASPTPELQEQWNTIKAYAEDDSDDALKLYDLMIPATFYSNQSVPKSFQNMIETATGSQLNSLLVRNYVQDNQSVAKATEIDYVEGGISFAVPGIYKNLAKVDLKSAYPSQVLRFQLYDKQKDPEAYFYKMVKYFTEKRFEYKKLGKETGQVYYKDLDAAAKVFINSAYGLCQTGGLNYNAPHLAEKITEETRKVLDLALKYVSSKDRDYWIELFKEKTKKKSKRKKTND